MRWIIPKFHILSLPVNLLPLTAMHVITTVLLNRGPNSHGMLSVCILRLCIKCISNWQKPSEIQ